MIIQESQQSKLRLSLQGSSTRFDHPGVDTRRSACINKLQPRRCVKGVSCAYSASNNGQTSCDHSRLCSREEPRRGCVARTVAAVVGCAAYAVGRDANVTIGASKKARRSAAARLPVDWSEMRPARQPYRRSASSRSRSDIEARWEWANEPMGCIWGPKMNL